MKQNIDTGAMTRHNMRKTKDCSLQAYHGRPQELLCTSFHVVDFRVYRNYYSKDFFLVAIIRGKTIVVPIRLKN